MVLLTAQLARTWTTMTMVLSFNLTASGICHQTESTLDNLKKGNKYNSIREFISRRIPFLIASFSDHVVQPSSKTGNVFVLYIVIKRRLRTFKNRILRRIFGPKRDENGEWRRLHNEVLHSLYSSPKVRVIKSRRFRWAGHVARMEEGRSAFKILTGKPTGKRPLGRPRRRCEDDVRMDLEKIGINAGNWVD